MAPGEASWAREAAIDRISALPDALLHRILSLLPAQQATRTCVLARRWVDLWKYTTGLRIVGADGKAAVKLEEVREFVDHLFLLRGTSPLEECEFRIVCDADVPRMNLWIRHALMCQVREPKHNVEMKGSFNPKELPSAISAHLKRVEVKCQTVDETVVGVLRFLSKLNILFNLQ
nr:unnamed protein product [Digitaria exilis]